MGGAWAWLIWMTAPAVTPTADGGTMKKFLRIAGPTFLLLGLLLVARIPSQAASAANAIQPDKPPEHLFVTSGPLWRGGLSLMALGGACLIVQSFLRE
jgi:hypothetical protein